MTKTGLINLIIRFFSLSLCGALIIGALYLQAQALQAESEPLHRGAHSAQWQTDSLHSASGSGRLAVDSLRPTADSLSPQSDSLKVGLSPAQPGISAQQGAAAAAYTAASQTKLPKGVKISPYDAIFQKEAPALGWDWVYLAAIAYHESGFRPAVSGSGAHGLMGITASTGRRVGYSVAQLKRPATAVQASVKIIKRFEACFKDIKDTGERIKFTLAAYNAGNSHIEDARRLARKHGANPDVWDDQVAVYLLHLSQAKYYRDPVVKHGRFNGKRVVQYVNRIVSKAQEYHAKGE